MPRFLKALRTPIVRADGSVVDSTLAEAKLRQRWGLGVVAVQREAAVFPNPGPDFRLQAGDVLVVFGRRDQDLGVRVTMWAGAGLAGR